MNRITASLALSAVALCAIAIGQSAPATQPCAVEFRATLHTYTGPIVIDNACMTSATHSGDSLTVEAVDMGDGIFKGDFELNGGGL